jgi:hypothetical protein
MDHARTLTHPGRLLRGLLVASLALGGAVVLATTGQAAVNPDIQVLSITQYGPDSGGQFQLIGEVRNAGTGAAGPVSVDVTFLDAADNVLFEDNTFTNVDAIGPGERAPFALTFPPMANYTHYTYVVNDGGGAVVNHNFAVAVTSRTFDGTYDHVLGTVTNNNTTTSQFTQVVGTAYDVNNLAVDVDSDFVSGTSSDVAAGATANFELIFLGGRRYDHTALLAQSSTPPAFAPPPSPSPPASPSPGASPPASPTPTPSPTAAGVPTQAPGGATGTGGPGGVTPASPRPTPTSSPTASSSPAPSPTATPPAGTGCRDADGPYVLRISPAFAKITRSGTVTLSARLLQNGKTCQAGMTVALYARGPGTTLFHISRTMTTDSQGLVHAVYSRPGADFRWYVRHATSVSGFGLVQVR